eukprot:COSAG05_NODE_482_length_9373_cov_198.471318_1_plen_1101_part_10
MSDIDRMMAAAERDNGIAEGIPGFAVGTGAEEVSKKALGFLKSAGKAVQSGAILAKEHAATAKEHVRADALREAAGKAMDSSKTLIHKTQEGAMQLVSNTDGVDYESTELTVTFEEPGSIGINLHRANKTLLPCTIGSPSLANASLQRYFDVATGKPLRDDTFIVLVGIDSENVEQERFEDLLGRLRVAPRPLRLVLRVYEPKQHLQTPRRRDQRTSAGALRRSSGAIARRFEQMREGQPAPGDEGSESSSESEGDEEVESQGDGGAESEQQEQELEEPAADPRQFLRERLVCYRASAHPGELVFASAAGDGQHFSSEDDDTDAARLSAYRATVSLLFFGGLGSHMLADEAVSGPARAARPNAPVVAGRDLYVEEIWQNQRSKWGKWNSEHLLRSERDGWSDREGTNTVKISPETVNLPPGEDGIPWEWLTKWEVDIDEALCDNEGWSYAASFASLDGWKLVEWRRKGGALYFVRKRRLVRVRCMATARQGRTMEALTQEARALVAATRSSVELTRQADAMQQRPSVPVRATAVAAVADVDLSKLSSDEKSRRKYAIKRGMMPEMSTSSIPSWEDIETYDMQSRSKKVEAAHEDTAAAPLTRAASNVSSRDSNALSTQSSSQLVTISNEPGVYACIRNVPVFAGLASASERVGTLTPGTEITGLELTLNHREDRCVRFESAMSSGGALLPRESFARESQVPDQSFKTYWAIARRAEDQATLMVKYAAAVSSAPPELTKDRCRILREAILPADYDTSDMELRRHNTHQQEKILRNIQEQGREVNKLTYATYHSELRSKPGTSFRRANIVIHNKSSYSLLLTTPKKKGEIQGLSAGRWRVSPPQEIFPAEENVPFGSESVGISTETIGEVDFMATHITQYHGDKPVTDGEKLRIKLKWSVTFTGEVLLKGKADPPLSVRSDHGSHNGFQSFYITEPAWMGRSRGPVSSVAKAWWEWKSDLSRDDNDQRAWEPYDVDESSKIERAFNAGTKVVTVSSNNSINFSEMCCRFSLGTGDVAERGNQPERRPIRRQTPAAGGATVGLHFRLVTDAMQLRADRLATFEKQQRLLDEHPLYNISTLGQQAFSSWKVAELQRMHPLDTLLR